MQTEITKKIATKVLEVVDAGLTNGVGHPIPGQMCVEAAVCYAMGLPHGDNPPCVAPVLRSLKIRINDAKWSSNEARAKGLRRLALAQLGSAGHLDEKEFGRRIVDCALRVSTPAALRSAASVIKDEKHKAALYEAAKRCEKEGTCQAAMDARAVAKAAASAAYAAASDAYAAASYAVSDAYAAASYAASAAYAAASDAYAAASYAASDAYAAASSAAYAAYAAASYAYAYADADKTARDKSLAEYCEAIVQILIDMKAPGCQWLDLAPVE